MVEDQIKAADLKQSKRCPHTSYFWDEMFNFKTLSGAWYFYPNLTTNFCVSIQKQKQHYISIILVQGFPSMRLLMSFWKILHWPPKFLDQSQSRLPLVTGYRMLNICVLVAQGHLWQHGGSHNWRLLAVWGLLIVPGSDMHLFLLENLYAGTVLLAEKSLQLWYFLFMGPLVALNYLNTWVVWDCLVRSPSEILKKLYNSRLACRAPTHSEFLIFTQNSEFFMISRRKTQNFEYYKSYHFIFLTAIAEGGPWASDCA